jgi:hypothetical protein
VARYRCAFAIVKRWLWHQDDAGLKGSADEGTADRAEAVDTDTAGH